MATTRNHIGNLLNTLAARWVLIAARVILGGIFVYAAYAKLHFDGRWHLGDYHFFFAMGINSYDIYPLWFTQLAARVVPWIELVLGAMMIAGIFLRWVSVAITALLVAFMVMLARAAILHLEINCGCFGINSVKPADELMRDSVFMLLALLVTAGAFLSHRAQRASA
jgi:uncharacterized membrane protein YphA (DoxX/SURF4 family)